MRRGYFTFYNEWDNNSLFFHLFFFNLTFSCPHSYHLMLTATCMCRPYLQGRIQDFKLEGALKRIAPSGGRRENVRVLRVKNHDFTPKNHIFSNFRGRAPGATPPPLDPPLIYTLNIRLYKYWHEQVILWENRWNNMRILLKIKYINRKLK